MSREFDYGRSPRSVLELRAIARLLGRTLQHELDTLERRRTDDYAGQITDVYNKVYLPRCRVLAEGIVGLGISKSELLREPLNASVAATQLKSLIELLRLVVHELGHQGNA